MTTYGQAGVDQDAADALIPILAGLAARTRRGQGAALGGFAGLFALDDVLARGLARPALALSTDGVGTKIELLRAAGAHRTAGWDCVAMNADDVVCSGAEPLVFVDYIAIERLDGDVVEGIVSGVADACVEAGCELVGGETAQHPGTMPPGSYDVSGTCVGIVDADAAWGPHRVQRGDAVVGIASSGVHANGFSLVRSLLEQGAEAPEDLLTPTAIYAKSLLAAARDVRIHAAAHVTGGGVPGNLPRALPDGLGTVLDPGAWDRPGAIRWLAEQVDQETLRATFNDGLGMLVITPDGPALTEALSADHRSWVVGEVVEGAGVRYR